ncbi:MAG: hypothetical protein ACC661_11375, partial [Verrucomicrobiales bacterium]
MKFLLAGALLLALATQWLWQHRFQASGGPPLVNPALTGSYQGWEVLGESGLRFEPSGDDAGALLLETSGGSPFPVLKQKLAESSNQRFLWLRCELASRDLQPGDSPWKTGRVILHGVDAAGRSRWSEEHHLGSVRGDQGWKTYEAVFELSPEMEELLIEIENFGRSGTMKIRGLAASYVENRNGLALATGVLLGLWGGWLMLMLTTLGEHRISRRRSLAGSLLILGAAWVLVLPGTRRLILPLWPGSFVGIGQVAQAVPPASSLPPVTIAEGRGEGDQA